jgi:hypothetical protein
MLNTDTIQPNTDDSDWNNFRCEEHDRIDAATAQGEQSNMMQADFGKWAKGNGTWTTVSSYHENVKMWYEDTSDVMWVGNYRYGEPVYETEYDGMEIYG